MANVSGVALGAVAGGALFIYGGLMHKSPLQALQALVQGKNPSTAPDTNVLQGVGSLSPDLQAQAIDPTAVTGSASADNTLTGGTAAQNKALTQFLALSHGWSGAQWTALDNLWTRESGFNNTALNQSSGAYGIAQALPATKYPKAGQASGGSSPSAQIEWGLSYIAERYGNPETAWQHEISEGWY